MFKRKSTFRIFSQSFRLLAKSKNPEFITVSNIKIETVESFIKRRGSIIQVATKVRRSKS